MLVLDPNTYVDIPVCDSFPFGAYLKVYCAEPQVGACIYYKDSQMVDGVEVQEDTVIVLSEKVSTIDGVEKWTATAITGTWGLSYGIHQGVPGTQDEGFKGGFVSLAAVEEAMNKKVDFHLGLGSQIWYGKAIPPVGSGMQPITLHKVNPPRGK